MMLVNALIFLCAIFFLNETPAWAYLNPGTGSYLFQIMFAFLFGLLFSIKIVYKSFKAALKNLFSRKKCDK